MIRAPGRRITTRAPFIVIFLTAALLWLTPDYADAVQTIDDPALGFKLTLPDGFTSLDNPASLLAGASHGFVYGAPSDSGNIVLLIVSEGKPFPHRQFERSDLGPDFRGKLERTTWQGLEVPLVEIDEEGNGFKAITYSVLIPLEREGLYVKLVGPAHRETELRSLLTQVIGGLAGRSNWPCSPPSLAGQRHSGGLFISAAIAIILAGLTILWLISRYAPRGTVLVISLLLFVGGNAHVPEKTAVSYLTIGSIKLIGFIGIILGIIDLRRRKKLPLARRLPNFEDEKLESESDKRDNAAATCPPTSPAGRDTGES